MVNKKGGILDLLLLMCVSFTIILIFGSVIYFFNVVNTQVTGIDEKVNPNDNETIGDIAGYTFGKFNEAVGTLRFLAIVIFFAMMLNIFVTAFVTRNLPIFFIFYVFILIILVFFSAILSNAYELIRQDAVLGATFQSFTALDYFILYMPWTITIIGFIAGILMYAVNIESGEMS